MAYYPGWGYPAASVAYPSYNWGHSGAFGGYDAYAPAFAPSYVAPQFYAPYPEAAYTPVVAPTITAPLPPQPAIFPSTVPAPPKLQREEFSPWLWNPKKYKYPEQMARRDRKSVV